MLLFYWIKQQIFGGRVSALDVDWLCLLNSLFYLDQHFFFHFLIQARKPRIKQLGLDLTFSVTISVNKLQIYMRMLQFLFAIFFFFQLEWN